MESAIEDVNAKPSYNSCVIKESDDMSIALDQYWARRKAARMAAVERLQLLSNDAEAAGVWQAYCRQHLGFLQKLLKSGADQFERELIGHLQWTRAVAQNARALFQKEAKLEIRIPFGQYPLRLVRAPGRQALYDVADDPAYDGADLEMGMPIVAICWRNQDLALLLPSQQVVELDTFVLTMDQVNWNTGAALPASFQSVLPAFRDQLLDAERAFARMHQVWEAQSQLAKARRDLEGIDRAVAVWQRVHIPDHQKVELLRRLELFEDGSPGAPRGLLLIGPPGNGKTSIARAVAQTLSCHIQLLSLPDFKMPSLGLSAQRVRERWNESRLHQPSIMFIDDCEGVLTRRGANEADKIGEEVVESFLPEWAGAREDARILLIGATNRPDVLDEGIISRFGWVMEIQPPDSENRSAIFAQELLAVHMTAEPSARTIELTRGMSGRDIKHLAASLRANCVSDQPTAEEISSAATAIRRMHNSAVNEQLSWDTLIIDNGILDRLRIISTLLKDAEDWRAHGVSVPRSLLLLGATDAEKEQAARTMARESGWNFLAPTLAQLKATILGGSANSVRQLFERGNSMAPVIIFLSNLDKLTPKQSPFEPKDRLTEEIASQLQQEMTGATLRDGHVFLIGATGDADLVDDDVRGIFDEQIEIPFPDARLRTRLLSVLLTGKKLGFTIPEGVLALSGRLHGDKISARDLARWVQAAEQRALARAVRDGGPQNLRIELEDFEAMPNRRA